MVLNNLLIKKLNSYSINTQKINNNKINLKYNNILIEGKIKTL
jgi:hypothetical protein